ncbi:unnamed protein product [Diabrotica balteata]|uniref:CHK kinase-like domain-containing protein n=1 Tax=Diabrotica balteata TaxID=107213 RepID=A0A9N9X6T2_DIABA|nr:unnamed protein product [Diabrotica balteata]
MSQTDFVIKNLPGLINPKLGHGKVLKDFRISRLTAAGANYGSVMLKLELTVADKNDEEETVHAVAKMLPDSEIFREIFHVQTTFTNEMAFYDVIVPTLQEFQRGLGIKEVVECFPKCYATRKNLLNNSDKINDDAIIILENLVGFRNVERTVGFDFETTKLILKDVALLHGIPMALKLKKGDLFEKNIKPYCSSFKPPESSWAVDILKLIINENAEIAHLSSKVVEWGKPPSSRVNEPFATLIHSDLWSNNIMHKFVEGKAVQNKFVDFQACEYGSPAKDIFFLLFTSVQLTALRLSLDYFLKYYWDHLVNVLKAHGCDVDVFTYDKFLEEMEYVSTYEFPHVLFFYNFVCNAPQHFQQDFENISPETACKRIPLRVKETTWYIVKECHKRGWLK